MRIFWLLSVSAVIAAAVSLAVSSGASDSAVFPPHGRSDGGAPRSSEWLSPREQERILKTSVQFWKTTDPSTTYKIRAGCHAGEIQIQWETHRELGAAGVLGRAAIDGCDPEATEPPVIKLWRGELRGELTATQTCRVAVHEMGHLLGYEHSSDPESVMYQEGQAGVSGAPEGASSGYALALCLSEMVPLQID